MPKELNQQRSKQLVLDMLKRVDQQSQSDAGERPIMFFTGKTSAGRSCAVSLFGDAHRAFKECAIAHGEGQSKPACWTRLGIERMLKRPLVEVLDAGSARETVTRETDKFMAEFFASPRTWRTYVPIYNADVPNGGVSVGGVTFEPSDKRALVDLLKSEFPGSQFAENLLTRDVVEPFALARADALGHEPHAARLTAQATILDTIDTLNFFGYSVTPRPGRRLGIFSSQQGIPPASWFLAACSGDGTMGFPDPILDRFPLGEVQRLQETAGDLALGLKLLARVEKRQVANAVLTALKWAGRATIARRPHDQFLGYAVSIESLLLEPKGTGELGYQLRMRAATVLRGNGSRTLRDLKYLYGVRSQIVHNGFTEVPDSDVADIEHYAGALALTMLRREDLLTLTWKEFALWFEEQWLARSTSLNIPDKSGAG